jgi:hypothetical protein
MGGGGVRAGVVKHWARTMVDGALLLRLLQLSLSAPAAAMPCALYCVHAGPGISGVTRLRQPLLLVEQASNCSHSARSARRICGGSAGVQAKGCDGCGLRRGNCMAG